MLVKFIQHSTIYMPGEVAEFPDQVARVLIARRAAVALGDETRPAKADETPETPETPEPPAAPPKPNKPDKPAKPK
jgi:hypothetical protein